MNTPQNVSVEVYYDCLYSKTSIVQKMLLSIIQVCSFHSVSDIIGICIMFSGYGKILNILVFISSQTIKIHCLHYFTSSILDSTKTAAAESFYNLSNNDFSHCKCGKSDGLR